MIRYTDYVREYLDTIYEQDIGEGLKKFMRWKSEHQIDWEDGDFWLEFYNQTAVLRDTDKDKYLHIKTHLDEVAKTVKEHAAASVH